ncbi:DUF4129 domain-containing protein [Halobellus rubicundus]|uniref:DUF4129 domain-containing protein n=1 Tax=Halobellus rubicundus TaxID=2996466 RepID=A0ABD5M9H7_9EURY
MDASTARRLAVALLAVAALAATAATIDTTVTGGTGGSLGGASGGAPSGAPAPLIDVPSGESAAVLGSVCVPFLARPPVVALLFALLAAGHYAVYRRSESLPTVVATAVGVGFPLALLWAVLVSCRLPTLSIDVGFEFGLGADGPGIVPFPVGSGGFGLGGEGSGSVATPSALFGLALFVALALAVVLLLASTGDELAGDDADDSADGDSEATPPDVRRVGEAAGDAADRLEAEADVGNEVYRAWVEMTNHLDVDRPESCTPGEFAAAAVDAGMDRDDVAELTRLFEEVRYGDEDVTDLRAERAVSALRRIESAYAGEGS